MQGVAPVRSYGAPLGAQAPVNAPDRPKVGPASAAVQHAALADKGLYRKPVGSQASPAPPPPKPNPITPTPASAAPDNPTRDLSANTAAQRVGSYPSQVNQAIDEQSK